MFAHVTEKNKTTNSHGGVTTSVPISLAAATPKSTRHLCNVGMTGTHMSAITSTMKTADDNDNDDVNDLCGPAAR